LEPNFELQELSITYTVREVVIHGMVSQLEGCSQGGS